MKLPNSLSRSAITCASLTLIGSAFSAPIDAYPDYFLGKNGWVISKLDYTDIIKHRDVASFWPQIHFDLLYKIVKSLESKGVNVIISVVPQRMNVYPQILPDDLYQDFIKSEVSYIGITNEIKKRGIKTTDILSAIKNSKYYNSTTATYYRFEPHWNFYGASAAAAAVSKDIKTYFPGLQLPKKTFTLTLGAPTTRAETFWLDNLPKDIQAGVPKDYNTPHTLKSEEDTGSLLSDEIPATVLVGTSFSGYGFRDALLFNMQTDILDQALGGKGMWTPMVQYLSGKAYSSSPPKLIIWEMPEYILANYPMPTDDDYKVFKEKLGIDK